MNKRTEKKYPFLGVCLLVVYVLIFLVYQPVKRKYELRKLEKEGLYSVGYISEIKRGRSSFYMVYYYYANGVKLEGNRSITADLRLNGKRIREEDHCRFIGKKYYIKFLIDDFGTSQLLLDKPVRKAHQSIPKTGWKKIPE